MENSAQSSLSESILKYVPHFNSDTLQIGIEKFELIDVKAKTIIQEKGDVSRYLYFAENSLSRCFFDDEKGEEQTLWIKPEQTFFTDYKSFVSQQPSQFGLQLYEDTLAYRISRENLLELYQNHQDWASFGIFLTEMLHVVLIDVFVNLLANDATRNYEYIQYAFPRFIQVAPLKDIASMLQMSPVSLSRIRAGKQTKGYSK